MHDFRWADRGSNVLSKGHDGYTPIGPVVAAEGLGAATLRLRTRVNGNVVQDAAADDLLFGFADLIADLSRFMTLERGDVILTGTPAGTGVVTPGDVVEVELVGLGSSVTSTVVEAGRQLAQLGAMPRATPAARAFATGVDAPRPVTLSSKADAALRRVSTATLTVQLAKRGVANTFLGGLRPTRPDLRMVGYAHTLRYAALREDVREARKGSEDAQKLAVETVSPGDVLIMEARGEPGAGRSATSSPHACSPAAARDRHGRRPSIAGCHGSGDPQLLPGASRSVSLAEAHSGGRGRANHVRRHAGHAR